MGSFARAWGSIGAFITPRDMAMRHYLRMSAMTTHSDEHIDYLLDIKGKADRVAGLV
jgi:hypothetical protein